MDTRVARMNMVEGQVRTNKVIDRRIIDALFELPREEFLPENLRSTAYVDADLALGKGRFVMEPMVLARLIQAAEIRSSDHALDLGAGGGYASALLARLAGDVVAVESAPALVALARSALAKSGAPQVSVIESALTDFSKLRGPFDVILINGAVAEIPTALTDRLEEGGRLVAVRREGGAVGHAVLVKKMLGVISERVLFDANTPYLPEFAPVESFVF
jgi:protein-L-isoaspartate(D-aspartate) O-methyltransferase